MTEPTHSTSSTEWPSQDTEFSGTESIMPTCALRAPTSVKFLNNKLSFESSHSKVLLHEFLISDGV